MLKSGIGGVGNEEKHINKPDKSNLASPLLIIDGELPWMYIAEPLASNPVIEEPCCHMKCRGTYSPVTFQSIILNRPPKGLQYSVVGGHSDFDSIQVVS